uniref:Four and a half LIM domains 2 n=1 Tax=Ornithorhynchus anatinus TaxID=9258 RepID=A0A6I8NWH3_ORNAN
MTERFDCHNCRESLFGQKYILREENPYCVACFESLYSNTCEECKKPIGCDCKDLSYKDRHWHESCFHCFQCKSSLVDKPFAAKEEHLLCTECYSREYSSKCSGCLKTIMPGTRKMEYKGNSWHETCFSCHRCQQPIGTKSFIPKDNQNFCVPCYEKQFAMQCVQCKKAIITGGVTYREQPWHKECFVCTGCKKQLSGQRFTSRDEFAYCLNCFCNLYAKKCAGCTNPISGRCLVGVKDGMSISDHSLGTECLFQNNALADVILIEHLLFFPRHDFQVSKGEKHLLHKGDGRLITILVTY